MYRERERKKKKGERLRRENANYPYVSPHGWRNWRRKRTEKELVSNQDTLASSCWCEGRNQTAEEMLECLWLVIRWQLIQALFDYLSLTQTTANFLCICVCVCVCVCEYKYSMYLQLSGCLLVCVSLVCMCACEPVQRLFELHWPEKLC